MLPFHASIDLETLSTLKLRTSGTLIPSAKATRLQHSPSNSPSLLSSYRFIPPYLWRKQDVSLRTRMNSPKTWNGQKGDGGWPLLSAYRDMASRLRYRMCAFVERKRRLLQGKPDTQSLFSSHGTGVLLIT